VVCQNIHLACFLWLKKIHLNNFCASMLSATLTLTSFGHSPKLAPQLWNVCKHTFRSIRLNSFWTSSELWRFEYEDCASTSSHSNLNKFSTFIKMLSTTILWILGSGGVCELFSKKVILNFNSDRKCLDTSCPTLIASVIEHTSMFCDSRLIRFHVKHFLFKYHWILRLRNFIASLRMTVASEKSLSLY